MQRGQNAAGHTVLKNACGDGLSGVIQFTLFAAEGTRSDLDKSFKQESPA